MKKITFLVFLFTLALYPSFAQSLIDWELEPSASAAQLFSLNKEQQNHHFHYRLPDDGILNIDFLRLSDWGEKNDLYAIAQMAAAQAALLKDSFIAASSTKTLALNIPIDKRVISINYKEDNSKKNQLAFKDNAYFQLKSDFDTIRIVKNVGVRSKPLVDSGLIQIQYTFILKDIQDIQKLADQPAVLNDIGTQTDTYLSEQRQKWHKQDAYHHTLLLDYDPEKSAGIQNNNANKLFPFLGNHVGVYIGFGAIVYENSISPYLDETIAYLAPSRGKTRKFVGLNLTAFGLLNGASTFFTNRNYATINGEFGICRQTTGLMQQKTSVTLGLMIHNQDDKRNNLFNMGFNYGFNSFLSAGFNFASDFKKDSKNNFWGVHFKFNL